MPFSEIQGILVISCENIMWPAPANVFVIPDKEGFCLIDVGCGGLPGPERLLNGLAHWGLRLEALHTILLTHAHPDHMGAMDWVLGDIRPKVLIHELDAASALQPARLNETFDIPLMKRETASAGLGEGLQDFDILCFFEQSGCPMAAATHAESLSEGEIVRLGRFSFEVVHTPGHSPGHISLIERERSILLPGDLVGKFPAWYTPTSGGLIGYLQSLEKLEALGAGIMIPSHGLVMEAPQQAIEKIRGNLLRRESVVLDSLSNGPRAFWELNQLLFENLHFRAFPGCGIVESHLLKLEKEGRARREGRMVLPAQ